MAHIVQIPYYNSKLDKYESRFLFEEAQYSDESLFEENFLGLLRPLLLRLEGLNLNVIFNRLFSVLTNQVLRIDFYTFLC
jgi:hypothetical protein